MVGDTLATQPQAIADTVRRALQELPQRSASIRLHPDDAARVRELLGESLAHGAHRLIEDDTLTPGGCVLEAGDTRVDATVQTRWRRIVESLGRDETDWDANDDR
jgi:flagellar assembly protein FliH